MFTFDSKYEPFYTVSASRSCYVFNYPPIFTMRIAPAWAAFSFLTRLVPARTFADSDMAASPRWFPVVGLVLGGLATLPVLLALALNQLTRLPAGALAEPMLRHPPIFAFFYVLIMFWGTRGLHWDGLADCFDAWGSGARGEAFQRILKDSRIGAFGVMGIALTLTGQIIALSAIVRDWSLEGGGTPALGVLFLAPAVGRAAMLTIPPGLPPHPVSTLGRIVSPGCTPRWAVGWWFCLLIAWTWSMGPRALLCLAPLVALCLVTLRHLARREGGFNGDFLGCACLLVETAAMLAALL